MLINRLRYTTPFIYAISLCENRKPINKFIELPDDKFEKQSSNKSKALGFSAIILASLTGLGTLLMNKKHPDVISIAQKALQDASNGKFIIKSEKEINKSIENSKRYYGEKLDGKRTTENLIYCLNDDAPGLQYHAYQVFSNLEHKKMITILKPYLENRNLEFDKESTNNLRGQVFNLLRDRGTAQEIDIIQQYLNPKDEWYKFAKIALDAIVKRGI